jgi:hypothetical protein
MGSRRTSAELLADLEKKKEQLAARIAIVSARAKQREKKDDDRRRILLGSIVLADLDTRPGLADYARARLPDVMQEKDRRLFPDLFDGDAA